MLERLKSIRPRLQELARLDPDFKLFGADSHGYQLAPPLAEGEVATFETLHSITIPADYRAFLLEVGSVGAGPFYGLNALGDASHLGKNGRPPDFLSSPFPLGDWLDLVDNPTNLSQSEMVSNSLLAGTLCLSHQGCGMYDLLVVAGDERGHVWTDDRMNDFGIFPVAPNRDEFGLSLEDGQLFTLAENERVAFLDWYEWWLDWSLEEAKSL